jgi:hypothetical protein
LALVIEEKNEQVRQLIAMGKERGYLLYDEVIDILPAEVRSSEALLNQCTEWCCIDRLSRQR